MTMRRLNAQSEHFNAELDALLAWESVNDNRLQQTVSDILAQVKAHGDKAVIDYSQRFDQLSASTMAELSLSPEQLLAAYHGLDDSQRQALTVAAERIRQYHAKQKQESWQYQEADGTVLGQQITALDRVGIYVPGGKASYPSSVLMNAIPAKVAGVAEVIMCVPTPRGEVNQLVLAAAYVAGVDKVFTVGGAQAVAALAYGTETIPKVDKIVGPGNSYVATAKRLVFGQVGIDMILSLIHI